MYRSAWTAVTVAIGMLEIVAVCSPWIWVGPLYVHGYQGDGLLFLAVGELSVGFTLAFLWLGRRGYALLGLAGGLVAGAVAFANFVSLVFHEVVTGTSGVVQLALAADATASGATEAIAGTFTLPADLFAIGIFGPMHLPALAEGMGRVSTSADSMLATLNAMALTPVAGRGLVMALAMGGLLSGLGCYLVAVSPGTRVRGVPVHRDTSRPDAFNSSPKR
jgi:hypothetical protein